MGNSVSAQIGPYSTKEDWGITLLGVQIGLPEVKTEYVNLPLADGELDLSESVTGRPSYGRREIVLTLAREDRTAEEWIGMCTRIAAGIHGKRMPLTLSFDAEYFYTGRMVCSTEKPAFDMSRYQIRAICDPFKQSHTVYEQQFNMGTNTFMLLGEQVVCPSWQVTSAEAVSHIDVNDGGIYTLSTAKAVTIPDILLLPGSNKINVIGTQPVQMRWRERRL